MFEVLGKSAVSIEPCERALDNPSARENDKASGGVGPLHNFDGPFADASQGIVEFVTSVAAIGEHMTQPGGSA